MDWPLIGKHARKRYTGLWADGQGHDEIDKAVAEHIYPDCLAGYVESPEELGRHSRRWDDKIVNDAPIRAILACAAGFQANVTPQTKHWFRLGLKLGENDRDRKAWLDEATTLLETVISSAELYDAFHLVYLYLALFGRAVMLLTEDLETVVRSVVLVPGTYALGGDYKGKVTSIVRRYALTADQLIAEFGKDAVPQKVQDAAEREDVTTRWVVYNLIEPNLDASGRPLDKLAESLTNIRHFAFRSVHWMEEGKDGERGGVLAVRGFRVNPIVAPRFFHSGHDLYGVGIGKRVLGTCKGLQKLESNKLKAAALMVDPSLNVPSTMKNTRISLAPGGVNFYDAGPNTGGMMIRPIIEHMPDSRQFDSDVIRYETRIQTAFHNDLFMTLQTVRDRDKTAYETEQIIREGMELLGPVVTSLDKDLLDRVVTTVFLYAVDAGIIPLPEWFAEGGAVQIRYVSAIHLAQRASELNKMQQYVQYLSGLATAAQDLSVMDNLNLDGAAIEAASILSVPAAIQRSAREVEGLRKQRAQQQAALVQQQQQMAAIDQITKAGGVRTEGTVAGEVIAGMKKEAK